MNYRPFIFSVLALVSAASLSSCNLINPLVRTALPFAGIKMALACLPEETMIDTPQGPRSIQDLTAGDVVTGYRGHPVRVQQKHIYREQPTTEFLCVAFDDGSSVETCGMHRIAGTRARDLAVGQTIANRRIRHITSRRGLLRSCDLLTEDEGYRISNIPVNSMIEEMHAAAAGLARAQP